MILYDLIGLEREIRQNHAEHEMRAEFRMDQATVLRDPAQPGGFGRRPFGNGTRVDVAHGANWNPREHRKRGFERPNSIEQDIVIVVAAGIASNAARGDLTPKIFLFRFLCTIETDHDQRARIGQDSSWIDSLFQTTLEVVHLAGIASRDPFPEITRPLRRQGTREADRVEPQGKTDPSDPIFERLHFAH